MLLDLGPKQVLVIVSIHIIMVVHGIGVGEGALQGK
jgi:hypothetical protein